MTSWRCGSMLVYYTRGCGVRIHLFCKNNFYRFCRFFRIHLGKTRMLQHCQQYHSPRRAKISSNQYFFLDFRDFLAFQSMCQSFLPSFAGSIEKAYNFELVIARILPQQFYCFFPGAENVGTKSTRCYS